LRQCCHRGLPKTRLQHLALAAALNVERLAAWLDGRPHAHARTSRFATILNADRAASVPLANRQMGCADEMARYFGDFLPRKITTGTRRAFLARSIFPTLRKAA
jgi:hypothetical protein